MASNGKTTAYDAAVAAAGTQAEKDRLRDLRLRFNAPPDSPEWQFYAVLAPLLTAAYDRGDLVAQLDRIESRLKMTAPKRAEPIVAGPTRDVVVFTVALLTCVAVAVVSAGVSPPAPFAAVVAAFGLGVAATLAYLSLAPIVTNRR